jgi:hypothetical protein
MKRSLFGILVCCAVVTAVGLSPAVSHAVLRHVTLSGQSASGYSYSGTGFLGLPGTTSPDSRRRPKIYNDFSSFDTSTVGDTVTMTYDILWGGDADPSRESQDWRFGFISSSANAGKGVSLGANFDIGNFAGSTYHEFFTDAAVTTGLGTPASGTMDSAFTGTLNGLDGNARIAQVGVDLSGGVGDFDDRTDTHQVTLTLERVANGYDLGMSWVNLTAASTPNTNSTTILTSDADPSVALAAGITSWDRLGFFVNDNNIDSAGPWTYALSNVSVEGNAAPLSLASSWSPNEYQIPLTASLGPIPNINIGSKGKTPLHLQLTGVDVSTLMIGDPDLGGIPVGPLFTSEEDGQTVIHVSTQELIANGILDGTSDSLLVAGQLLDGTFFEALGTFSQSGGLAAVSAVPEPSSLILLGLGGVGWMFRRRR